MTLAAAMILVGTLLLYCAIKGKSLKSALVGQSVAGGSGKILSGSTVSGSGSTG